MSLSTMEDSYTLTRPLPEPRCHSAYESVPGVPPDESQGSIVSPVSAVTCCLCLLHIGLDRPGSQDQRVC